MVEELKELKLLGQGAFGKCYLSESPQDGSKYVIKQINIEGMSEEEKSQAYNEARVMQVFDHPNIICFREIHTANGKLNIVMDYADGGDLDNKIKNQKGKFFPEKQILDWFVQMCLAMKHVHDRKVLHRDLKAQNVFLMQSGVVKLGDFGIAKVLSSTAEKAKTVVGTPYYLSPEIIENKPYNFKSDVWSMGVLLYQLCTLKPPFDASSIHFLALKIVRGAYPPIPPHFTKDLKTLVAQMLSIDPMKRPTFSKILRMPFIKSRIQNFLSESIRQKELTQTNLAKEIRPQTRPNKPRHKKLNHSQKVFEPRKTNEFSKIEQQKKLRETRERKEQEIQARKLKNEEARKQKAEEREQMRQKMREDIKKKKQNLERKPSEDFTIEWLGNQDKDHERMLEVLRSAYEEENQEDEDTPEESKETPEESKESPEDPKKVPNTQLAKVSAEAEELVKNSQTGDISKDGKLEELRFYLEKELGTEVLVQSYHILKSFISSQDEYWDYDRCFEELSDILPSGKKDFLSLIHTLIYLEDH